MFLSGFFSLLQTSLACLTYGDVHTYNSEAVWVELQIWVSSIIQMKIKAIGVDGISHPMIIATEVRRRGYFEREWMFQSARFCLSKTENWTAAFTKFVFGKCSFSEETRAAARFLTLNLDWKVERKAEERKQLMEKSDSRGHILMEMMEKKCESRGFYLRLNFLNSCWNVDEKRLG